MVAVVLPEPVVVVVRDITMGGAGWGVCHKSNPRPLQDLGGLKEKSKSKGETDDA
jgi:hypothetical protein